MRVHERGAAIGKYLLLLIFLGLFVGWYFWKQSYGTVGTVAKLASSTKDYIAFIRTDSSGGCNLFIVKADGTGLGQLTNDDAPKRMPVWSPDGSRLCYAQETRAEGSATYQLFVLGKGAPRQITYGSISKDMPRWRSDGKLIAFLSGGAIKVVTPNAADLSQVYPPPHKGGGAQGDDNRDEAGEDLSSFRRPPIVWFDWSPTAQSLAGIQVMEGENAAVLGNSGWWSQPKGMPSDFGGGTLVEPESIVVLPHLEAEPFVLPGAEKVQFDWMPDGRRIVASLTTRQGRHALVRFRTDEKNLPVEPILTADRNTIVCEQPAVSPDGSQVAFELWKSQGLDRVLVGVAVVPVDQPQPLIIRKVADAESLRVIVKGDARMPRWSPDGTRLLYRKVTPKGTTDLCVVRLDGGEVMNLTKGVGDNTDGMWSPALR